MTATIIRSRYCPAPVTILDPDMSDVFDLDRADWFVIDRAARNAPDRHIPARVTLPVRVH